MIICQSALLFTCSWGRIYGFMPFLKGISVKGNAFNLVQTMNSGYQFHFLQYWPLQWVHLHNSYIYIYIYISSSRHADSTDDSLNSLTICPFLSVILLAKSSKWHLMSVPSSWIYDFACWPILVCLCVEVHRRALLIGFFAFYIASQLAM